MLGHVDWLLDLILPSTDGGVLVQLVAVLLVFGLLLWRFRRDPEIRLVLIGSGLVILGLFGFRALH